MKLGLELGVGGLWIRILGRRFHVWVLQEINLQRNQPPTSLYGPELALEA